MRRNCLIFLLLLFPALLVVSCGGKLGVVFPDYSVYDDINPEKTHISVGHKLDYEALKAFKELAAEFNDTNEYGIVVEFTDAAADMIIASEAETASLQEASAIIELSALARHPRWGLGRERKSFYGGLGLRIASIPLLTDAEFIIYSKRILEAVGETNFPGSWFSLNRLLGDISSSSSNPAMGINLQSDSVIPIINARGGSVIRPLVKSYSFNNRVVVRALRYLRKMNESGVISFENSAYRNQTEFVFGNLFSVFTGSEGIKYYDELISAVNPAAEWDVAALPTRRPGTGVTVSLSSCGAIFDGEAEKELAAWLFIKWLSGVPQQVRLSVMSGSLPANSRAAEEIIELPDVVPQWKEAVKIYNKGFKKRLPKRADYIVIKEQFNAVINRSLEGSWIWLELLKFNFEVINKQ